MPAIIIDGTAQAASVRDVVKTRAQRLREEGKIVNLAALMVGASPAGELYAKRQAEACQAVGINYQLLTLPADARADTVAATIARLNKDASVTGIMMHLPLPRHLDETEMQYEIERVKDVEGVNPSNIGHVVYRHTLIAPCTALAAMELIRSTGVTIRGAEAVVVGASAIAGKPAALLLLEEMATVNVCHIATRDLAEHTRRAEILIVAVGKPDLIRAEHVRPGAVVIDVGINRVTLADGSKKTVGDVDFESVRNVAGHLTPVPGGVGPMTVAMLLKNTLRCAELVFGLELEEDAVPATTQHCPDIPLKHVRHEELRPFLRQLLRRDQGIPVSEIYRQVLAQFGSEKCRPDANCPNYRKAHPEFWHITRLALWDGQRGGEFSRAGAGLWKRA